MAGEGFKLVLFPKQDATRQASVLRGTKGLNANNSCYLCVDEGHFDKNGIFTADRERTGDECDMGLWVSSDIGVVRVAAGCVKEGADMRKKKNISKYLFVLPGFCFFAFAMLIPFCMGFHIAFTDWDGVGIKYNFVGLKNFQMIFQDIRVRGPFLNTLEFAVLGTIFGNVIPLTLAMFVNGKYQKLNTVARVAFFYTGCLSSRADRVFVEVSVS